MIEIVDTTYPTRPTFVDHSGDIINGIKILRWLGKDKYNQYIYECRCHCGKIFNVSWKQLGQGRPKSCGCIRGLKARKDDQYIKYLHQKFDNLEIIDFYRSEKNSRSIPYFKCRCDCGKETNTPVYKILSGDVTSCGCMRYVRQKENYQPSKDILSEIGNTYNYLKIIGFCRKEISGQMHNFYKCECRCGSIVDVECWYVLNGKIRSCGCFPNNGAKTHGLCYSKLYKKWTSMKQRCYNPKTRAWDDYGGRGIKLCDEWIAYDHANRINTGFLNFYNWAMNSGYEEGLTIDRINNDGDYEPTNCRWVGKREQALNNRKSIYITYEQQFDEIDKPPIRYTFPLPIWSEITGISREIILRRLRKNRNKWTVERALTTVPSTDNRTDPFILIIGKYIEYNMPDKYEESIHD